MAFALPEFLSGLFLWPKLRGYKELWEKILRTTIKCKRYHQINSVTKNWILDMHFRLKDLQLATFAIAHPFSGGDHSCLNINYDFVLESRIIEATICYNMLSSSCQQSKGGIVPDEVGVIM